MEYLAWGTEAMVILGIDPATKTGIAYRRGKEWHTETVNAETYRELHTAIVSALCAMGWSAVVEDEIHAVIEDLNVTLNHKTVVSIARTQGRIGAILSDFDVPYTYVHNKTWRTILAVSGHTPKTRKELKEAALWYARNVLKADPKDDNQADAACIAAWGEAQLRRRVK